MGFARWVLLAALCTTPLFAQDDSFSCPERLAPPGNLTDYYHHAVENAGHQRLAGRMHVSENRLWFFPEMDEPLLMGTGNPVVFEPGVEVEAHALVLTYVLPERKRR